MRIEKAKIRQPSAELSQNNSINKRRSSTYSELYKGEFYNIDVDKLIPFKEQSRKSFDKKSLQELANTIKMYGIRQPLTILPSERIPGKYEIISGERRWRAAQIINLVKVPCIILQDKKQAEEIALIENVQRKNLHPFELMRGFQNLLDKGVCKTQQDIAKKIGISRTIVVETLALQKLPEPTKKILLEKNIKSRDIFRELLKAQDKNHINIITQFTDNKYSPISTKPNIFNKNTNKKNTLLSIYIKSGDLVLNEGKNWQLTEEQKTTIKQHLHKIINKI